MLYYIKEFSRAVGANKTAAAKARVDVNAIMESRGFQQLENEITFGGREDERGLSKLITHFKVKRSWEACTKELKNGDTLLVQFPCVEHSIFLASVLKGLIRKGVYVVLLIHDLELLRTAKMQNKSFTNKLRLSLEEKSVLMCAQAIIAHNDAMVNYLTEEIGVAESKIVSLGIFDYLIDTFDVSRIEQRKVGQTLPVIIAGNLAPQKAQYVYHLPDTQAFILYGVNYEGEPSNTLLYKGAFAPEEVPYVLEGSFGLVWDGDSAASCTGAFGAYLQINNPHKTSLYLASGIPVVIWSKAALADFIIAHHCGIAVDSLYDIPKVLQNMTDQEYAALCAGARAVGDKLRQGYYFSTALDKCLKMAKMKNT